MAKKKPTKARTHRKATVSAASATAQPKGRVKTSGGRSVAKAVEAKVKAAEVKPLDSAKPDNAQKAPAPKLTQASVPSRSRRPAAKLLGKSALKSNVASGNGSVQPASEERAALTDAQLRKVKTGLSKRDLQNYRGLLLAKRAEIFGDVTTMEGDARNNSGGNLSSMPMHMADIGSDNYEQEFTLGLVESERKLLREIDEALLRIQSGIYGVCLETGVPIARARLDAKPWAKYCIEVARAKEKAGSNGN